MNEGWPSLPKTADDSQLDMLVTFNYVVAGLLILFSLGFVPHLILISGVFPDFSFPDKGPNAFPQTFRLIFGTFVVCGILIFWTIAIASLFSAKYIRQRTHWRFSIGTAIAQCLWTPLGTALGVFSLVVLYRDSVKAKYLR